MRHTFKTKEEWLAFREGKYGGVDASAILGLNKWRTPRDVYLSAMKLSTPDDINFRMRLGSAIEAGVADLFAEEMGIDLIKYSDDIEYYTHDEHPFIGGSPDKRFWYEGDDGKRKKGVIEVKTTSATFDHNTYPDSWDIQIQMYLGLSGLKRGYITWLELKNTELKWVEVEYDEQAYQHIITKIVEFHDTYVVNKVEPPMITSGDVAEKYPFSKPNKTIDISEVKDENIEEIYSELVSLKEKVKPYEERIDVLKEKVKMVMLDAEVLTAHDQILFTWKSSRDKEVFDEKKFLSEHPEFFEQYKILKRGSRRFLPKY